MGCGQKYVVLTLKPLTCLNLSVTTFRHAEPWTGKSQLLIWPDCNDTLVLHVELLMDSDNGDRAQKKPRTCHVLASQVSAWINERRRRWERQRIRKVREVQWCAGCRYVKAENKKHEQHLTPFIASGAIGGVA